MGLISAANGEFAVSKIFDLICMFGGDWISLAI